MSSPAEMSLWHWLPDFPVQAPVQVHAQVQSSGACTQCGRKFLHRRREMGARVRPGLLSGRAGRSAFSPGTTGLSLARPTAPMSMKHSCSPSSPIRHRGRGRLRCRAKILTTGTRQLPSFEDCQGWRAAGQHRWRRALLDGLSRYRSPWFRRPARNDLLVSDTMIDGVRATLAYSYPVSSSAPDQSIADIPAKAPLLMKRRPAFNPNSKAVMAPAATASLETLARCRVMSAIGT